MVGTWLVVDAWTRLVDKRREESIRLLFIGGNEGRSREDC